MTAELRGADVTSKLWRSGNPPEIPIRIQQIPPRQRPPTRPPTQEVERLWRGTGKCGPWYWCPTSGQWEHPSAEEPQATTPRHWVETLSSDPGNVPGQWGSPGDFESAEPIQPGPQLNMDPPMQSQVCISSLGYNNAMPNVPRQKTVGQLSGHTVSSGAGPPDPTVYGPDRTPPPMHLSPNRIWANDRIWQV